MRNFDYVMIPTFERDDLISSGSVPWGSRNSLLYSRNTDLDTVHTNSRNSLLYSRNTDLHSLLEH